MEQNAGLMGIISLIIRRTRWFIPGAQRYHVKTPVEIVAQDIFNGRTESISVWGARVRFQRDMGSITKDLRFVDIVFPEIRNLKVKSLVVDYNDNVLRLKFKDLRGKNRSVYREWLKSQDGILQDLSS